MTKELYQKIIDLFEYRKLPWMLQHSMLDGADRLTYYHELIDLQAAIFEYDKILEESWEPDVDRLHKTWQGVRKKMIDLGVPPEDVDGWLHEIEIYADNEMKMREGHRLSDIDIQVFYYYKSCDVRLMRRLILANTDIAYQGDQIDSWRIFDYVTEVNDDVSDLKEDSASFNGNRLLQCMTDKRPHGARDEYVRFLNHCEIENRKNRELGRPTIEQWIIDELGQTKRLIVQATGSETMLKIVEGAVINERIN